MTSVYPILLMTLISINSWAQITLNITTFSDASIKPELRIHGESFLYAKGKSFLKKESTSSVPSQWGASIDGQIIPLTQNTHTKEIDYNDIASWVPGSLLDLQAKYVHENIWGYFKKANTDILITSDAKKVNEIGIYTSINKSTLSTLSERFSLTNHNLNVLSKFELQNTLPSCTNMELEKFFNSETMFQNENNQYGPAGKRIFQYSKQNLQEKRMDSFLSISVSNLKNVPNEYSNKDIISPDINELNKFLQDPDSSLHVYLKNIPIHEWTGDGLYTTTLNGILKCHFENLSPNEDNTFKLTFTCDYNNSDIAKPIEISNNLKFITYNQANQNIKEEDRVTYHINLLK
jgi:hypothetical protein